MLTLTRKRHGPFSSSSSAATLLSSCEYGTHADKICAKYIFSVLYLAVLTLSGLVGCRKSGLSIALDIGL